MRIRSVTVDGLRVGFREVGQGPVVLLLHGWPTSSYLWRNVMGPIAERHRVVAVDLPGFGASDKPARRYDAGFYDTVLDGFRDALGIDTVALGVHDLGGPVGLHWAASRPPRIWALALLNTLVYPELGDEVVEFARALLDRDRRKEITSDRYLEETMRLGIVDQTRITPDLLAAVTRPFRTDEDRLALARAGCGLRRRDLAAIATWLPTVTVPMRIIYGAEDRVLPDVAHTMERVAIDVPHAEITVLPDCGHSSRRTSRRSSASCSRASSSVSAARRCGRGFLFSVTALATVDRPETPARRGRSAAVKEGGSAVSVGWAPESGRWAGGRRTTRPMGDTPMTPASAKERRNSSGSGPQSRRR